MPDSREYHGHAALVGRLDDLGVAERSAWLDRRRGARVRSGDEAVGKGKERLADHYGTLQVEAGFARLPHGDPRAVDACHLTRADAERLLAAAVDDGIRLHVLAHLPAK